VKKSQKKVKKENKKVKRIIGTERRNERQQEAK
jgi:hypothetical protein